MVRIGAHVDQEDPVAEATQREADVVQFFLGDPQGWKKPQIPEALTARTDADVDCYVHAPYVINVASPNNRIRIPSRKQLAQQAEAAARIGAKGLIVHGGHVRSEEEPELGYENWRKAFERLDLPLPILIENTAGGANAMTRSLDSLARLWEALDGYDVGFCLDTCHAHAGGEQLIDVVDRVKAITGRIDLVHCNNSRDGFDSRRDRHTNLESGEIDPELLVEVVRSADAPVVCETPGGPSEQARDIAWLRSRLDARV